MADQDTYLKLLSEALPGDAMFALGVDGVELVAHLPTEADLGTVRYQVDNVFLANLDGDAELDVVERDLATDSWEPGDRLRLALALNMAVEDRSYTFERVLDLVKRVPGPEETDLITSALMALAEPTLGKRERERLRKELKMVSKIAEELYQDGIAEGRVLGRKEGRKAGRLAVNSL